MIVLGVDGVVKLPEQSQSLLSVDMKLLEKLEDDSPVESGKRERELKSDATTHGDRKLT